MTLHQAASTQLKVLSIILLPCPLLLVDSEHWQRWKNWLDWIGGCVYRHLHIAAGYQCRRLRPHGMSLLLCQLAPLASSAAAHSAEEPQTGMHRRQRQSQRHSPSQLALRLKEGRRVVLSQHLSRLLTLLLPGWRRGMGRTGCLHSANRCRWAAAPLRRPPAFTQTRWKTATLPAGAHVPAMKVDTAAEAPLKVCNVHSFHVPAMLSSLCGPPSIAMPCRAGPSSVNHNMM